MSVFEALAIATVFVLMVLGLLALVMTLFFGWKDGGWND